MQSKAILTALLVVSAFAGATAVSALDIDTLSDVNKASDTPPALQQDGEITGENVTIRSVNLTNVTLEDVYVNRLVANVTHDGTSKRVELQNVSAAAIAVGNASVRNFTFDTVGMNRQFSTDLLDRVGTGTDPEDTLPPEPMLASNLSDRTITGIEFGTLEVSSGTLQNVTLEGESEDVSENVTNATLSGQGVTVETARARNVTVVGWSADEMNSNGNETGSSVGSN